MFDIETDNIMKIQSAAKQIKLVLNILIKTKLDNKYGNQVRQ